MNRAALFNRYPEWIIGQDGASRFITHCRYPRLIAKIHRQTDGECPGGHFYFFRRQTGRRSPICRRPYRNLPPGSQKNRVCTRLADMLPSKYEDNTLQIKERSTKR
ncbi:hypothetical protein ACEL14_001887, partial [Neisseria gonorrhoeae]